MTIVGGLVAISPAWSLTVTAPENTVVAAGRDYATEVLADPWDMDKVTDIDIFELRDLTNPTFTDGVLRATTTGADSNIWMIFQGVPSAFNLTRGALYPIDNSRYTHLSLKMRLNPPYSAPCRCEGPTGPVAGTFRDRAHRKRTRLSGEDARPSETPWTRGLAAPQ